MLEIIEFNKEKYLSFQKIGRASQFAIPYALHVCKGEGYDIGCMKKEWSFPNSIPIDISFDNEFHALNLPKKNVDYIFSSHCLEHIDGWVDVMDYWHEIIKKSGVLFLYLPDYSQEYWRPWFNKKHRNILTPEIIRDYMNYRGYKDIFISGVDLNNSFMVVGGK